MEGLLTEVILRLALVLVQTVSRIKAFALINLISSALRVLKMSNPQDQLLLFCSRIKLLYWIFFVTSHSNNFMHC